MGHKQRCSRALLPKADEGLEQIHLELDIEALERLIEQHQLCRMGERAGDGHPLSHTPRQLGWIEAGTIRQAHHLKIVQYYTLPLDSTGHE
ncbi:hypothetical protein SDC9_52601 [bioreactor metagenome]|uniref:Uncharacterized protein n=1 Tax=bioreactor metagenome TaxID=1076179 RepID=A0A644WRD5_9ZZZZ